MKDCLFCKIINKEIPSDSVYEDEEVYAFNDIHPLAPVHILVIPKKHIKSMNDITNDEVELIGKMFLIAKELAQKNGISKDGYKLLFRVGKHGGQEVPHIHLHLIGGAPLSENIRPLK